MSISACASTATPPVEEADIAAMDDDGCGYGCWLGSPDERVAVRFEAAHEIAAGG